MKPAEYFQGLEQQFKMRARELAGSASRPSRDLHAIVDDKRQDAESWGQKTREMIDAGDAIGDAALGDAGGAARLAAHYAGIVSKGEGEARFGVAGGPSDAGERTVLHREFRARAVEGAFAAGLVKSDASEEDAFRAWITKLWEGPHSRRDSGIIDGLFGASALLCVDLRVEAMRREVSTLGASETGSLANRSQDAAGEYIFRKTPDGCWEVAYAGYVKSELPHLEGMCLIQMLLRHPGKVLGADVLLRRQSPADVLRGSGAQQEPAGPARPRLPLRGDAVVSPEAIRAVREQLVDVVGRIEIARTQDVEEVVRLTAQELKLRVYLKKNVDKRGRSRRLGSDVERHRKAALKQYTTALRSLKNVLPPLAEHLHQYIKRGATFSYDPKDDLPWKT